MYQGIANSPPTILTQPINETASTIYVERTSGIFPTAPNRAVIGMDAETAETIFYASMTEDSLRGCVRGFEGTVAKSWDAEEVIRRNWTNGDYAALRKNIENLNSETETLNEDKTEKTDFANHKTNEIPAEQHLYYDSGGSKFYTSDDAAVFTDKNMGEGSNLDADLLRGLAPDEFMRWNSAATPLEVINDPNCKAGDYSIDSTVARAIGLDSMSWHMLVLETISSNGYGFQIAFPMTGDRFNIRARQALGTTWSAWFKIWNEGNLIVESGTWTPRILNGSYNYSRQSGSYQRVGNKVDVAGTIMVSQVNSTGGTLDIVGLPPTLPIGVMGGVSIGALSNLDKAGFDGEVIGAFQVAEQSIRLRLVISNSNYINFSTASIKNGFFIAFSGTYFLQ